jgi:hypothetical protein
VIKLFNFFSGEQQISLGKTDTGLASTFEEQVRVFCLNLYVIIFHSICFCNGTKKNFLACQQ